MSRRWPPWAERPGGRNRGTDGRTAPPPRWPSSHSVSVRWPGGLSLGAFRQRLVVLLHQLPEFLRHVVAAREDDGVLVGVRLAAEAELEAFQPFGDDALQALKLGCVLVDTRVIKLAQRAQNFVELPRVDVLCAQVATQLRRVAGPLANFTAKLADVFGREPPVAAPLPTVPVGVSVVAAAAIDAAEVAAASEVIAVADLPVATALTVGRL